MFKKILVGVDGSPGSLKAAERAVDLARTLGANITFLTVVPPPTVLLGELMTPEVIDVEPLVRAAREALEALRKKLAGEGLRIDIQVELGDPASVILETAESEGYDLIVVGRTGTTGIDRILLGSVTKKILEAAKTDVLVVA